MITAPQLEAALERLLGGRATDANRESIGVALAAERITVAPGTLEEAPVAAHIDCRTSRACKFVLCIFLGATLAGGLSLWAQPSTFSPRLKTPRIAPVPEQGRTEAQRQMLASRPDYNIYKTLAHHPELYSRWSGLGRFVLNGSSIPARHREMLMLRMGWLCQSEYEWSQHARIATTSAGVTDAEVHRIAEGPQAPGWTYFERTLLRMVDELRYDAMVSNETWSALRKEYSDQKMMEALCTAAQYQLVSMALNSLGVQLDPELRHRLPRDMPLPRLAGHATDQVHHLIDGHTRTTSNIVHCASTAFRRSGDGRADGVGDEGEITRLLAVAVDRKRFTVQRGPQETMKAHVRTLARSVHRKVSQR